jgi:hypothetical protein
MKPSPKKLLIAFLILLFALLLFDYFRAEFQYRNNVAALKNSAEKLRRGMSTEQVIAIMGKSSATINTGNYESELSVWNWKSATPERWLWRKINSRRCENPFEVIALWDGIGLGLVTFENG